MAILQQSASLSASDVFNEIRTLENEITTLKEIQKRDMVTSVDDVIQDLTKNVNGYAILFRDRRPRRRDSILKMGRYHRE